jgi:hypothetical protein
MSALKSTVFPAPVGPMIASELPAATLKLKSSRTWVAPKETDRCSTSSAAGVTRAWDVIPR